MDSIKSRFALSFFGSKSILLRSKMSDISVCSTISWEMVEVSGVLRSNASHRSSSSSAFLRRSSSSLKKRSGVSSSLTIFPSLSSTYLRNVVQSITVTIVSNLTLSRSGIP